MADFSLTAGKEFLNPVVINRYLRKPIVERAAFWIKGSLMAGCVIFLTLGLTLGGKVLIDAQAHLADRKLILSRAISASNLNAENASTNKRSKASLDVISSRNIFGPLQAPKINTQATNQQKPKTPLTLIGTFVAGPKVNHYAIIEDPKRSLQDVFSYGDVVFGDASVELITPDEVKLKRSNGEIETLVLDDSPISSSSGTSGSAQVEQISVDKAELDQSLSNLPLLLTQARAVPYFKDGKPVGLRLFAIKSGSMFEKIGLKNGDILKHINGNSMTDITQAVKLFEQLRNERSISVLVERNREERELQYQIR